MSTEDSNEAMDTIKVSEKSEKFLKTSLCQYYLAGTCKNTTEECQYAHGTSDLRILGGVKQIQAAAGTKTRKTTLCENFLKFGECEYGPSCNYAHGIRELQKALANLCNDINGNGTTEAVSGGGGGGSGEPLPAHANNPAFKTSLCSAYMEGHYCSFADKCQYAHGRHELREKTKMNPTELSEEMRNKLAAKAKNKPDYKTRLCKNFEETGECDYGEICNYAHGKEELNTDAINAKAALEEIVKKNPAYRTSLCKSGVNCRNKDTTCQFAHTQDELRVNGMVFGSGTFGFGIGGPPAPGFGPYPPGPSVPPMPPQGADPLYKTKMCKSFETGVCKFGTGCNFAHGLADLRSPARGGIGKPPQPPRPPMNGGVGPMVGGMPGATIQNGKFKTVMCEKITSQGHCPRGYMCGFSHSQAELVTARERDPTYKTKICSTWKESGGECSKGAMCIFAHGVADLRTKFSGGLGGEGYGPPGGGGSSAQAHAARTNPKFRTQLCVTYMTRGACTLQFTSCTFAHGEDQLVNKDSYKTVMCKNVSDSGAVNCDRGVACHYAHSRSELRPVASPGWGAYGGGSIGDGFAQPGIGTFDYGHGAKLTAGKRKVANLKTALCKNYKESGKCQWGEYCNFAHGVAELAVNKRQKL